MSVLVAEDDRSARRELESTLIEWGFDIVVACGQIDDRYVRRELELIKRQRREIEAELITTEQEGHIESLDTVGAIRLS